MSRVAHPISSFNSLDPFHRAHSPRVLPVHKTILASGKSSFSFEASEAAPRETRSLDLDRRQRLPIGPQSSGSGSRSSTPTPVYPSSTASSRSSLDSINSRETRAQRRQGSIFNVPVSLNPALNTSYSSLVAMHSQTLDSDGESFSQPSATSSARETGSGRTNKRLRKANPPAPLDLDASTRPTRNPPPRPPTPGVARPSKRDPPLASLPSDPRPPRTRRRSRSTSFFLNPSSDSSFPTPLTPSFRFLAPQLPEHREKKLNKLAKTLGENIPASLVFPSTSSSTSTSATSKADLSVPTTPVSGGLKTTDRVNEKSSRRVSKMLQALDLDSSLPSRQKNPKGISTWQPPAEWSMDPSEMKRDRDAPGFEYEGEEMYDDDVQGGWNADDYGAVLEHLRNLK